MKNNSLMMAMVLVLAMAAAVWAQSGWTITRDEAREIRHAVEKILPPPANMLFRAGAFGTSIKINPGTSFLNSMTEIRISIDARVYVVSRGSINAVTETRVKEAIETVLRPRGSEALRR